MYMELRQILSSANRAADRRVLHVRANNMLGDSRLLLSSVKRTRKEGPRKRSEVSDVLHAVLRPDPFEAFAAKRVGVHGFPKKSLTNV